MTAEVWLKADTSQYSVMQWLCKNGYVSDNPQRMRELNDAVHCELLPVKNNGVLGTHIADAHYRITFHKRFSALLLDHGAKT